MSLLDNKSVSDEKLNAYLDDELDFDEKRQVFELLCEDKALSQEAQELRQLQSLLRHAYRNAPPPSANRNIPSRKRRTYYLQGLAASLMLGFGALVGWFSHQQLGADLFYAMGDGASDSSSRRVSMDGRNIALASNVILHLNSADPVKFKVALDRSEELLQSRRREGREFRLEIIANKGGVELLRRDRSPFPQRVEALMAKYDNVTFMACANALRQLEEQGVKVDLLPGIKTDHTAIDKIINRLEQGWSYLRV